MHRPRGRRCLTVGAAASALAALLLAPPLTAQPPSAPPSGAPKRAPRAPGSMLVQTDADEVQPQLVPGPDGRLWRLWERTVEARQGGGAILLDEAAEGGAWRQLLEVRPSDPGVTARDPVLAVGSEGRLAVVYRWWRHQPRAKRLRMARSGDGGRTWIHPAAFVDDQGHAFSPQLAWGKDQVLVAAWSDERRSRRQFTLYARRSADGGETWGPEVVVSAFDADAPRDMHYAPRLLGDGGSRFWLAWVGLRAGRSAVYLSRSEDGGQRWTAPVSISGASESVSNLHLVRAGERLLAVWEDQRSGRNAIFAAVSADGGLTWLTEARVAPDVAVESATTAASPAVLLGPDGEAVLAWQDTRDGREDIYVARSSDDGRTWQKAQRADDDDAGTAFSRYPTLAWGPGREVAVAWEDDRAGYERVFVRVWASDRTRWGPETLAAVPARKHANRLPRVAWPAPGRLVVSWESWDHLTGGTTPVKRLGGSALTPPLPPAP